MSLPRMRVWTALTVVAVLAAIAWLAGSNPTQAAGGGVSMDAGVTVAPGGDVKVDLVATPDACVYVPADPGPPEEPEYYKDCLSVWFVKVAFDPAVVSVPDVVPDPDPEPVIEECDNFDMPGGGEGMAACVLDDQNDTVAVVGGFVFDTGEGLEAEFVLAAIPFHAEGSEGDCGDLTITVESFLDPKGNELTPTVTNGQICIAGGQQRVWGDVDCSGAFNVIDGRKIVVKSFGGSPAKVDPTCPTIGDPVSVDGTQRTWGDVDCSGAFNVIDGRKIVVKSFGGSPAKVDPTCPSIGDTVTVQ